MNSARRSSGDSVIPYVTPRTGFKKFAAPSVFGGEFETMPTRTSGEMLSVTLYDASSDEAIVVPSASETGSS